jgi:hypothetical protein
MLYLPQTSVVFSTLKTLWIDFVCDFVKEGVDTPDWLLAHGARVTPETVIQAAERGSRGLYWRSW